MNITELDPNVFLLAGEKIVDRRVIHCCIALSETLMFELKNYSDANYYEEFFHSLFKPERLNPDVPYFNDWELDIDTQQMSRTLALCLCATIIQDLLDDVQPINY